MLARSTAVEPQHTVRQTAKAKRGYGRSIYFPQDMVQRAAVAIRKAFSNDTLLLARVALEAAIRFESDLLDLLPPETPTKPLQRPAGGLHASV
jgi:intergrase/recombinase